MTHRCSVASALQPPEPTVDEAGHDLLIALKLPPTTSATEVYHGQLAAFEQIDSVPQEHRLGLIDADAFKQVVKADCDQLLGLVRKAGTLGALALPAGLSPITDVLLYEHPQPGLEAGAEHSGGHVSEAIFASEDHCYHIRMQTSLE